MDRSTGLGPECCGRRRGRPSIARGRIGGWKGCRGVGRGVGSSIVPWAVKGGLLTEGGGLWIAATGWRASLKLCFMDHEL